MMSIIHTNKQKNGCSNEALTLNRQAKALFPRFVTIFKAYKMSVEASDFENLNPVCNNIYLLYNVQVEVKRRDIVTSSTSTRFICTSLVLNRSLY